MNLFVFAHLKEAQTFIDKLDLEKENISLHTIFSKKDDILILSGEGVSNTISTLTSIISSYKESISRILNFGIAGRLDPQLRLNKCYSINSVIMNKKSYELDSDGEGISCVTSHHQISNESDARRILKLGQVVDMELWAVADVAASFGISVQSVKLISDDASQAIPLNEVLKNVKFYSERLFDYFSKHF